MVNYICRCSRNPLYNQTKTKKKPNKPLSPQAIPTTKLPASEVQTLSDNTAKSEKSGEEVHRYPLAQVEFSRVQVPFIIGVWILFASIAKIGK